MNTDVEKISQAIFSISGREPYKSSAGLGLLSRVDLLSQHVVKVKVNYYCCKQDGSQTEGPDKDVLLACLRKYLTGYLIKKSPTETSIIEYELVKASSLSDATIVFVIADDSLYNAHDFVTGAFNVKAEQATATLDAIGQYVKVLYSNEDKTEYCVASMAFPSFVSLSDDDTDLLAVLNGCVTAAGRNILRKHGCEDNLQSLLITLIV